jgi:hypothetical protein
MYDIKSKIKEPKTKRNWGPIIGIIVGIVVTVAVLIFAINWFRDWTSYRGSPDEILAVADQFKPDPAWTLTREIVHPPANGCIDKQCPSLFRDWRVDSGLTPEFIKQIEKLLGETEWNFDKGKVCEYQEHRKDGKGNIYQSTLTCRGTVNSFDSHLMITNDYRKDGTPSNQSDISLYVSR